jgi:hypothetical protein
MTVEKQAIALKTPNERYGDVTPTTIPEPFGYNAVMNATQP